MKSFIIGIAGAKNSGKDTVASMIDYIFAVGITKANYKHYIINNSNYRTTTTDRVIHFGDNVKDVLSVLYNIPRNLFDMRSYKDELWYNIRTNRFISFCNIDRDTAIFIHTNFINKEFSLNEYLTAYPNKQIYIRLRTLMQYFATDICRNYLADDIWIKSTMAKAVDIAEGRRVCIIPDVRFANEAKAIRTKDDSLYGGVIKICRNIDSISEHSSEIIDVPYDFIIENNDTLMVLFYKVLEICQKIM